MLGLASVEIVLSVETGIVLTVEMEHWVVVAAETELVSVTGCNCARELGVLL